LGSYKALKSSYQKGSIGSILLLEILFDENQMIIVIHNFQN
jgi:hypothetical protein